MWKFVTRGIRKSLERRTSCQTNVYSQTSQDSNSKCEVKTHLTCNHKFLAPTLLYCKTGLYNFTRVGGTKDKHRDSSDWNAKYSWTEAVGWSSILAVGWVVCQTLCLHRRFFEVDPNAAWRKKFSFVPKTNVSQLLAQLLNLQPQHVLPVTNCVGSNNDRNTNNVLEEEWTANEPYGPITIEEALQEARDEFTHTHRLVMGEFELRVGVKALQDKHYKEALKHFSVGAKLSHPGSTFNLGLCYEMGLGTLVDYVKAARYYHDAAEKGHADAMYNLGVFHAQGRGVELDIDKARILFTKAAKLGQTKAQYALDLEKPETQLEQTNNVILREDVNNLSLNNVQHNNKEDNILMQLAGYENEIVTNLDAQSASQTLFSKQRIHQTKNPTEIFLDFLGLHEPSPIPIIIGTSENEMLY